jgi:hypothetical protein
MLWLAICLSRTPQLGYNWLKDPRWSIISMIEKTQVTGKLSQPKLPWRYVGLLFVFTATIASAQVVPPPAPIMDLEDGRLLVNLARSGMLEFIQSRTPAGKQQLTPALKGLSARIHPATVTLRSSGKLVARSYRADTNVCRSVLAAALEAMRSGDLPNRVTPAVLAGLTVEVEVHGKPRAVSVAELDSSVVKGLTGVTVSRGRLRETLLPSTSCGLGLSIDQIRMVCLARLAGPSARPGGKDAWSIFTSKHYVGYPGKKGVHLYRGKILLPTSSLTEAALKEAAATAGLFLINSQGSDGAYSRQNRQAAIHEHLYATYAMAKLSRRDKRKIFSASVTEALKYAARFVMADDTQARVLSRSAKGKSRQSPTRATAWLLLTISQLPADPAHRKLAEKLARALQQDVVSVVGPDHGLATPDQLADWSVALLALRSFLPKTPKSAAQLEPLVKTLQAWSKSGQTLSPLVYRSMGGELSLPKWRQVDDSDLPDRRGGFVSSGVEPTTFDTATAAICLHQALGRLRVSSEENAATRKQVLRARQFCAQMVYRRLEAYWVAKPEKMTGGLRNSPAAASVSLESCAAAIEAFCLD